MKVLFSSIRYPPAAGGAEFLISQIKDFLKDTAYIKVFTSDLKNHIDFLKYGRKEIKSTADGVKRFFSLHIPRTTLSLQPNLFLKSLTEEFDIYWGFCWLYFPAFAAAVSAALKKKPFIITPVFDVYNTQKNKKTLNFMYRTAYKKARLWHFISRFEMESFLKEGFSPQKKIIIPPAVDTAAVKAVKAEKNTDGFQICYVGRLARGKGIEELLKCVIELIKEKNDVKLFIAGEDFGVKEKLREEINKSGFSNKLKILGYLSEEEKFKLIKKSNLFVLPSVYEAFGIVLIEAMASGTAVLAASNSAIVEVTEGGKYAELFNLKQKVELKKKIMYLIQNKNKVKEFENKGKTRAGDFNSAALRPLYENTLKELMN